MVSAKPKGAALRASVEVRFDIRGLVSLITIGVDFADDCMVDLQHKSSFYMLTLLTSSHVLEPYLGRQA